MKWVENNIFPLLPAFLFVILVTANLKIDLSFKVDTILIIIGNFAIAFYIASAINKRVKNEELRINNCFKELDFLQDLLMELRKSIKESEDPQELQDEITRFMSLIMLQVELIKKYDFIDEKHKEKTFENYYKLDKFLTDGNQIDEQYKLSILQMEREILNIKSSIL